MTTVHSYTNDQVLTDVYHKDLRRARSATHSMIPTKTGAATARGTRPTGTQGQARRLRHPGSDNQCIAGGLEFRCRSRHQRRGNQHADEGCGRTGPLKDILAYADAPLVSVDYNHDPHSSIYDATMTKVIGGTLVKVCGWYDNEWAFANRMLDTALAWSRAA